MNPYIPAPKPMPLDPITLDDGQVIKGKFGDLTQHQLISLANQLLRAGNYKDWRLVMEYHHAKFLAPHSPPPLQAA